jgi:hypothetical protein
VAELDWDALIVAALSLAIFTGLNGRDYLPWIDAVQFL